MTDICFVDGRKESPVNHGPSSADSLLEVSKRENRFIHLVGPLSLTILAVCPLGGTTMSVGKLYVSSWHEFSCKINCVGRTVNKQVSTISSCASSKCVSFYKSEHNPNHLHMKHHKVNRLKPSETNKITLHIFICNQIKNKRDKSVNCPCSQIVISQ